MTHSNKIEITENQTQKLNEILEPFVGSLNDECTRQQIKYTVINYINSLYPSDYVIDCEISSEGNDVKITPFETNILKSDRSLDII